MNGRDLEILVASFLQRLLVPCLLLACVPALAQDPSPRPKPKPATLEEVVRLLEEQRKIIEAQDKRIRELEKRLQETSDLTLSNRSQIEAKHQAEQEKGGGAAITARPPEAPGLATQEATSAPAAPPVAASATPAAPPVAPSATPAALPPTAAAPPAPASATPAAVSEAVKQDLKKQEAAQIKKNPELEVADIAKEFPGSFRIPGTNAALRIGGQVRMNVVFNLTALGSDDRFVTSSIPMEGSEPAGKGRRTTFTMAPTRFNLDFRTPTGVGYTRAFIEGDFANDNNGFRLRHAYAQWWKLLIGQTWSTFSDPQAEPDGIDFEGLNAISLFRQPQIRWTQGLGQRYGFALALENPKPSVSGPATGISQMPDVIARLRWNPRDELRMPLGIQAEGAHVQTALLLRQLNAEPTALVNDVVSARGYGINVSGRLPVGWYDWSDAVTFAAYAGVGIGNYISDLRTLGGQDAYYNILTNQLEPLPVLAGYLGYQHWWNERTRSTVTYGIVDVRNVDAQAGDALHRTDRATMNLVWSPIPRLDLAAELLWGRRLNKDGQQGTATQVQIGGIFRF